MRVIESLKEKVHRGPSPVMAISAAEYFSNKLEYESTPYDLKSRMDKGDVVVLDVRDREAFAKEHIPGALNVPAEELPRNFSSLPKDKTLVTCCWNITCHLATRAALELAQKGFRVQELIGGIDEWKKRGLQVRGKR